MRDRTFGFFRASLFLTAILGVASCAGMDASLAPPDAVFGVDQEPPPATASTKLTTDRERPSGNTDSVLRRILANPDAAPPQVLKFYQARKFQPVWSGRTENLEMARQVRAVLARAHEQGLSDDDYRLPGNSARLAPGADAARYDLALTERLLRYASDVRMGRVRPRDVYDDIDMSPVRFDAAAELTLALKNRSLPAFLSDLPPPHPEYRRLVQALAHYRAIADAGGWPMLPDANGIAIDGKNSKAGLLVMRLAFEDPELAANPNPAKAELQEAIKRFQARNGLDADGQVGRQTITAMNIPASDRVEDIAANMERWRWMPRQFERRYIAVNVPDQSLAYIRDGEVMLSSRVIVGRKANPTPITRSAIVAVVANPPWNIPGFIAARDLLPRLRKNANYLASKNMVVTDGPSGDPHGRTIDWRNIQPATFPYSIQQLPGPETALGKVMLDSPNDFDVYLHDTPGKKMFARDDREISNGCVRVQQIFPLASLALTGDSDEGMERLNKTIASRKTERLELETPLPVYFLYWTALPDPSGEVEFRPDLYGRDKPLIAALTHTGGGIPLPKEKPKPAPTPIETGVIEADGLSP